MSKDIDLQALAQPIIFDTEQWFPDEDLKQLDYDKECHVVLDDTCIYSFDITLAGVLDQGLTMIMGFRYQAPPNDIKKSS